MSPNLIISVLDIAAWFKKKANTLKQELSSQKLHNLIFLSQLHYFKLHKQLLIPTMFVCTKDGFLEPTLQNITTNNIPIKISFSLSDNITLMLESVWQKYSPLSNLEITEFVQSQPCWKNNYSKENFKFVNIADEPDIYLYPKFSQQSTISGSNIRLSQNGPVQISPWKPRKHCASPQLNNKKEN